jgi:hypothetical protein
MRSWAYPKPKVKPRQLHPNNASALTEKADRTPFEIREGYGVLYLQVDQRDEMWRFCVFQFDWDNPSMGEYASPYVSGDYPTEARAVEEGMQALFVQGRKWLGK